MQSNRTSRALLSFHLQHFISHGLFTPTHLTPNLLSLHRLITSALEEEPSNVPLPQHPQHPQHPSQRLAYRATSLLCHHNVRSSKPHVQNHKTTSLRNREHTSETRTKQKITPISLSRSTSNPSQLQQNIPHPTPHTTTLPHHPIPHHTPSQQTTIWAAL